MKIFKVKIIKLINSKLFIGLCLLIIFTPATFSKPLNNSLPYGWSKIKNMSNIETINKKCEFDHSLDYTNSDIENFQKKCPLEFISNSNILENIKKKTLWQRKKYIFISQINFPFFW